MAAIGAVAVVLAALGALAVLDGDSVRSGNQAGALQAATPTPTGTTTPSSRNAVAMDGCRVVHRQQGRVLRTAHRSLAQWRLHVEAMNRLVAGEITLDQARAYWEQTRVGARAHVAGFERAEAAYAGAAGCGQSSRCIAGVQARDQAIGSARRAINTWTQHMEHMDMLRSGTMTPEQATQMWLHSWHKGVAELDRHADDRRRAARIDAC
ncbi:MAG TPA: hypothetical protein VFG63_06830 [Nocardioidaceae bacterium]|nr:hypothetical protein [Nocardioidaceae bacterium]